MNKKDASEKIMPKVLRMLEAQSGESLERAKKHLSEMGIEDPRARESLEIYANNWKDLIHPSILSLSSDAVSAGTPVINDLQVMVLLLTAAMDIHDDVMDKSTTKNGKATLYGKFGEDLAILVGDALLMESFAILFSSRNSMDSLSFDRIFESVKKTLLEVGNAHLFELQLKKKCISPKEILNLIEKKSAIFEGLAEIGAIAGNGSRNQINALKSSARTFGYLVMLREEFIDMFEPSELISRFKNEYLPLPILYAMEDPKVTKYLLMLESGKIGSKQVQELINLVYKNQKVIQLKETMKRRSAMTSEILETEELIKEPASFLALLIRSSLEDL